MLYSVTFTKKYAYEVEASTPDEAFAKGVKYFKAELEEKADVSYDSSSVDKIRVIN